jgi:hypothetical protein
VSAASPTSFKALFFLYMDVDFLLRNLLLVSNLISLLERVEDEFTD